MTNATERVAKAIGEWFDSPALRTPEMHTEDDKVLAAYLIAQGIGSVDEARREAVHDFAIAMQQALINRPDLKGDDIGVSIVAEATRFLSTVSPEAQQPEIDEAIADAKHQQMEADRLAVCPICRGEDRQYKAEVYEGRYGWCHGRNLLATRRPNNPPVYLAIRCKASDIRIAWEKEHDSKRGGDQ